LSLNVTKASAFARRKSMPVPPGSQRTVIPRPALCAPELARSIEIPASSLWIWPATTTLPAESTWSKRGQAAGVQLWLQ
jgi:hypothetical protein